MPCHGIRILEQRFAVLCLRHYGNLHSTGKLGDLSGQKRTVPPSLTAPAIAVGVFWRHAPADREYVVMEAPVLQIRVRTPMRIVSSQLTLGKKPGAKAR